tara:strand:+ start:785 stop:1057 length:273 start_codon:yes stop_codon:yes gene_type:complete
MGINKSNVTDRERALFLTFVKWKNLVGSLVRCNDMRGFGLLKSVRVWNDEDVHLRIFWIVSPFINFKVERQFSWHKADAIIVVSEMQKTS